MTERDGNGSTLQVQLLGDLLAEMRAMRLELGVGLGGVHAGLSGVREDIQALSGRIDNVVDAHARELARVRDRLERIERHLGMAPGKE